MSGRCKEHIDELVRSAHSKAQAYLSDLKRASRRPTVAAWFDLLGFQIDLNDAEWIASAPAMSTAFMRVAGLHHAAIDAMDRVHEIVQMNDAVIIARDLPDLQAKHDMREFFLKVDEFFEVSARVERLVGGHGIRCVVAQGNRLNLQANLGWYPEDAPRERPCLVSPRPINMNTAFGKAYAVESSHQLPKGSCVYVERLLLEAWTEAWPDSWDRGSDLEIAGMGAFTQVRADSA